ncbi:integral membrane sensor signal transduction histidine kinase [Stanieria cyanosphaera PCC 7437]|uniref:histidine kinase n=1 Tax=Stanieria cyanosphaera (strain ATCC 29371 / PCC 7437) TaxID=111780 RepID=K9XNM9_STAC7|nr:sensor histidine kinase [Stanieria cyanosphaera]AFZ34123.1 integral membrane sensor signal transduction histidine kinase [Stanieria cyanosphaera PCC 7437]
MNYEWKKHPFRLLLYLEWILLGIALVAGFSLFLERHRLPFPVHNPSTIFPIGATISIILLGVMGWRLPIGSRLVQGLYISFGFGLSWLAVLLGGRGDRVFPALLLIVVIRACLLFPWSGRIVVSVFSYLSFLLLQVMSWLKISPFGIPLGKPLPRVIRYLPSEELQNLLLSLIINSALLFGLVLAFVLLLVGAVLAENQSREKLAVANRRLRQYALTIENQATLQERNRIAREIHDSVGHYLTAQSIQLENTALFLFQEPQKAANHLQKARQLGKEALQNVRNAVATLRNDPLKTRSLSISLEQLITEFKRNTGIEVKSEINLSVGLASEVALVLYRIIQEALTNISKHSQATLVQLRLTEQKQMIQLQIEDNGQGFNPTDNTTGFGLQSMRERTEALNGNFCLASKLEQGCHIKVEIPLWRIINRDD